MAKTPLTLEQMVTVVNEHMYFSGYRPVVESDLVAGRELIMVDMQTFCDSPNGHIDPRHAAGCTIIRLDKNPVAKGRTDRLIKIVFYYIGDNFDLLYAPLRDILRTVYEHDSDHFANDTRYFVRC